MSSTKKKLRGQLTISRPSYGDGRESVSIELIDDLSGTHTLEVRIDYRSFTQVICGLSRVKCEYDIYPEEVGRIKEGKTEKVRFSSENRISRSEEKAAKLLKKYEKDGWIGRVDDLFNPHRHGRDDKGDYSTVSFHRFVDAFPVEVPHDAEHPWLPYDGDNDKKEYELFLKTGEIVTPCYPYLDTFICLEDPGRIVVRSQITHVREFKIRKMIRIKGVNE